LTLTVLIGIGLTVAGCCSRAGVEYGFLAATAHLLAGKLDNAHEIGGEPLDPPVVERKLCPLLDRCANTGGPKGMDANPRSA
jgi:hypothetical protein